MPNALDYLKNLEDANDDQALFRINQDDLFSRLLSSKSMNIQSSVMGEEAEHTAGAKVQKVHRVGAVQNTDLVPEDGPFLNMTQNQLNAFKKYPALIDTLGTAMGEKLVKEIVASLNSLWVTKVGQNSLEISPSAIACKVAGKNLKQYFVPEDKSWTCCVTASGPFCGDDAIVYDRESDSALILRKVEDELVDVTASFNIVHEYAEPENGETE